MEKPDLAAEMAKTLREFPEKILSASVKERVQTFRAVQNVLSNANITEQIAKGLSRVLLMTVHRYHDPQSRRVVREFLTFLIQKCELEGIKFGDIFTGVLSDYCKHLERIYVTKSTSKGLIEVFKWICMVGNKEANLSPVYIDLLGLVSSMIQTKRLQESVRSKTGQLAESLNEEALNQLFRGLVKSEKGLVTLSYLALEYGGRNKLDRILQPQGPLTKKDVIDAYIQTCITTKNKVSPWLLETIGSGIVRYIVGAEEFKDLLLPAIRKAMLRSPETAIEAVGFTLLSTNVNLNPFALEIGKMLATSLHSQTDATRELAIFASKSLSQMTECSKTLLEIIDWYFAVFNGSEGKLTVAAHKMHILQAIKDMSNSGVSETDVGKLAASVLDKSVKVLETEGHEGTLVECCDGMTKWACRLGTENSQGLLNYIPKGLTNLKGAARNAFCNLLVVVFDGNRINSVDATLPAILKSLEKNSSQLFQVPTLSESLALGVVLRRAVAAGKNVPDTGLALTSSIFSHVNEKFINGCQVLSVLHVVQLAALHISQNEASIELPLQAVAFSLINVHYTVLKVLIATLKTLVYLESSVVIFKSLVQAISKMQEEVEVLVKPTLLEAIAVICVEGNKELGKKVINPNELALAFLRVCHQYPENGIWESVLRKLEISPAEMCRFEWKELQKYIDEFEDDSVHRKILTTLTAHSTRDNPRVRLPVIEKFQMLLDDIAIRNVTRDEYFIFMTPEGQLYDNSCLETGDGDLGRNMKRESKVYSYKEQLEEIQLRKELEEKRKQAGKAVQLTHKQKEAMKAQLEKESLVRNSVKLLDMKVRSAVGLLDAVLDANTEEIFFIVSTVLPQLIDIMNSPLSAPIATSFFLRLGASAFQDSETQLGESVPQLSLRFIGPQCDLDKRWQAEPILSALKRVMKEIEKISEDSDRFTKACYLFCYSMFERAVKKHSREPEILTSFLNITIATLKQRAQYEAISVAVLPRSDLTVLLYHIIGTNTGRTQQQGISAILELAKAETDNPTYYHIVEPLELKKHLDALTSHLKVIRSIGIRCLTILRVSLEYKWRGGDKKLWNSIIGNVYREQFDPENELAGLSKELYEELCKPHNGEYINRHDYEALHEELLKCVLHTTEEVRLSSASALKDLLSHNQSHVKSVVLHLIELYHEYLIMAPPVYDHLGRILQEGIDKWEGRCGVGVAIRDLASLFPTDLARSTMKWLVTETLPDRNQNVHNQMLEAAVEVVQVHGKESLNEFVEVIERSLDQAGKTGQYDNVRQACVVLMGSLARHIDPKDSRVKSIFDTLIETLATPSEKVQEAVANCLPGLVPAIKDREDEILKKLLTTLLTAETYGERRGAAYGLAGLIKGLGILSLKQHDVMNVLANSMQDKKNYKYREGALMALELLCEFLGRLFEPYIVHVLPYLLQCLGDSNPYVREATDNTAKTLMSKLSGHGVKLVLPSLLAALNEDSWRTKCGSVDLLGRMAYCAPKQLSGCLPMIVPRLIEVLGDSHVKVQESGAKALGLIGSVIRNPEIQSVVKILLEALQDPSKKTSTCLQALLKTEFVHFVDPPSLALIMPVVQRAFQDRSTENRKMASQIIGNMYSLTDHTDLAPYMDKVMPGLKTSLLDPVPEVRAVAAKALGSMSKGMGEKCYDELLPWLMKTLISEASSVDRSGGAQGLAEVIGALGEEKMHRFMPEIIRKADSDDLAPHVRDGYMMMFIYMPSVFEEAFVPYIGQIINPILRALADENEYVRETALKAGQRIVTGFAESAITLLLPELEKGIFDDNWRIRFSSVQLLGDLLYKISGVSGKMSTESASDDDNFGTEQSQKTIVNALGLERRNRVLAGLYMGRSDVALMVRQAALHVWKVVVANTPKTLREILPTLFSLLLGCLASPSHDKRQVAARTLGDLVRKLGEKILPEIIPILEKGLESQRDDERQGVCIGLSEIMNSTSKEMVMAFVENLVPTLRRALCDPSPEVREAAAQTFGSLHATVGVRALDEILPFMMKKLYDTEEGDYALHGLGQVLQVKSKAVLPYLIPQLTAPPPNTKALAILASVAGDSLSRHLSKILPALISTLVKMEETPEFESEKTYCEQVVLAVIDKQGVRVLIDELLELVKSSEPKSKRAVVILLSTFCIHTKADLEAYIGQLLRGLILLLADEDEQILRSASEALTALVKGLSSDDQQKCVSDVRQAVRFAQSDLKGKTTLPGLCLPKGINPVLPIFREALLNGGAELKEQAAIGMGELISLSSAEALKPSVVHITGPLIRILGDRYGPNVKTAVLDTLTLLLAKIGSHLRAFLPQLQTTFLKAVVDPQRSVRLKAAVAMANLIPIHNKPDPLFSELLQSVVQAESGPMRDTLLYTLRCVITPAGDKISEPLRKSMIAELTDLLSSGEDVTRITAASCLGALLKWLPASDLDSIMSDVLSPEEKSWQLRHGRTSVLAVGLKEGTEVVYSEKRRPKIDKNISGMLASDKAPIVGNGVRACANIFIHSINHEPDTGIPAILAQPFAKALNNASNEVKVLLGNACEIIGRRVYPRVIPKELMKYVIPSLVNGTKEKNSMVRASCESALVSLLHLRQGDSTMNICLESLETGAREALSDVIAKALRKLLHQSEGKEPEIDDTILT
ncbi:unnamed protein product [Allacma fusca]|uniref:TOG domain-containing protein n=1 Tax=Allacma fusca TaxID=39272 RepID=A0A8J2PL32_9HEXA|nr:unnamed protein product [Allacma fusca]